MFHFTSFFKHSLTFTRTVSRIVIDFESWVFMLVYKGSPD